MKIFFMLIFLFTTLFAQQFTPRPFITIDGDNQNVFVSQNVHFEPVQYICWENRFNDRYNIMMRRISPDTGSIILVASDIRPLVHPQILARGDKVALVWQMDVNQRGRIYYKTFNTGVADSAYIISDSTRDARQPTISDAHIAWVDDSVLTIVPIDNNYSRIDLPCKGCSDPSLEGSDGNRIFGLYYRQQTDSVANIVYFHFNNYYQDSISTKIISGGIDSDSPRSSMAYDYVFRQHIDSIWRIIFGWDSNDPNAFSLDTLELYHPYYYHFNEGIVGANHLQSQRFYGSQLLIFDAAPKGTSDIYFKGYSYYAEMDTDTINVSQSPYLDEKAVMTAVPRYDYPHDSSDVLIFWEHTGANHKTDIWWAKERFWIPTALDENISIHPSNPELLANYPNPFNPSTVIRYRLPKKQKIELTVYDVQGRQVKQLFKGVQTAGEHFLIFDATGLGSGLYFAVLEAGRHFIQSQKLILLK